MQRARTLFDTIWNGHVVDHSRRSDGAPDTLYIDLHLLHEVTSPQAFDQLRERRLGVRRPGQCLATMDHSIPTEAPGHDGRARHASEAARRQVAELERNCRQFGVPLYPAGHERQGIVHVIAPELGLSQPGMTIVCGDSHTATHGAFGAIAFGIGTGQVAHVLATQCLLARTPRTFEVRLEGRLGRGVTAKDVVLAVIAAIGTEGGTGHAFEFTGSAVAGMDMEQRMTLCNMAIEGGARCGLVAPDDTTFEYLAGREFAPRGRAWEQALERWRRLRSQEGAAHHRSFTLDVDRLEPMITYGTSPGMAMPITAAVPDPAQLADTGSRETARRALAYMGLEPGTRLLGRPVDVVFIGSCTNGRIGDLRQAAAVLDGRRVADGVRMLVVPGSQQVRRQAESEGLDAVFARAGAEWRQPGCSMCLAMNGDVVPPGRYAVSTSNRNFEGRQGPGSRTFLASPLTAAACAVTGTISDVREVAP